MSTDEQAIRDTLCPICDGTGLVAVYTPDGSDFEGAGTCQKCEGLGLLWIVGARSLVTGGGKFRGSLPRGKITGVTKL